MANERLKAAITAAKVGIEDISESVGVDPKTVQRWIKGRIPHEKNRWKIAQLLNQKESYLWSLDNRIDELSQIEVIAAYGRRSDVSASQWWDLFSRAQYQIDLLANAMLFIPEQNSRIVELFIEKAHHGSKIRIILAHPESEAVRLRDEEERLGGTLPARIKTTLYHFHSMKGKKGIEMRYHTTILYNSLFRGDDHMFVTPHLYGLHGSKAPLLDLRNLGEQGIFASFARHFDDVWDTAVPID